MGDKLSPAESAAIAAYKGKITKCPPGAAIGSDTGWLGNDTVVRLDVWLAERGLSFVPLPKSNDWVGYTWTPNTAENRKVFAGQFKKAA